MHELSLVAFPSEHALTGPVRPILKWAGGKSQLLAELEGRLPSSFNGYIEPFFGGGALFFHLAHRLVPGAIIADINPELVNLYEQVARNVEEIIGWLRSASATEEEFYRIRKLDWRALRPEEAAARTIFLNRTCFNGLYRVNKRGEFNVPFGRYANPSICNAPGLRAASQALKSATILCADYKTVLREYVSPGNLVFLDPPYLPISQYSDFKRYTKEGFYEEDHRELAAEVAALRELGAHVILTNSNAPLVHELYSSYQLSVVSTKRFINKDGGKRTGEDVIVHVEPAEKRKLVLVRTPVPAQVAKFPSTRFMGSKEKLLGKIHEVTSALDFDTAVDLFAGTNVVGYLFKAQGKQVISNDYLAMSNVFAKATIENNDVRLSQADVDSLLSRPNDSETFVQDTFRGIFFSDAENRVIDQIRANIRRLRNPYKIALATAALIRACMKKQARGVFTYVGARYDDGRKDVRASIAEHFRAAVDALNGAVFSNGKEHSARRGDAMSLSVPEGGRCLVYIDPPYYSQLSDNDYVRRYHFVEGIARNWEGVQIQQHTAVKKFKGYPTPFSTRNGAHSAFDSLFRKLRRHTLVVSYSSNSLPSRDELVGLLMRHKSNVEVVEVDYRYSFANQGANIDDNKNKVREFLFVAF